MRADEFKKLLSQTKRETLIEIAVEIYKKIPTRERSAGIDEIIRLKASGEDKKAQKRAKELIAPEALAAAFDQYADDVRQGVYYNDRAVLKTQGRSWKKDLDALMKSIKAVPADPEICENIGAAAWNAYRALLLGSRLKRCLPGIKYFEWFYGFGKDMALAALSCAFSQQEPSRELFDKALKNYFIPSLYPFQIIRLGSNELYRSYDDSKYAAAVFLGFFEKDLQNEELKKAACDAMCSCFGKYVKDMFAVRSMSDKDCRLVFQEGRENTYHCYHNLILRWQMMMMFIITAQLDGDGTEYTGKLCDVILKARSASLTETLYQQRFNLDRYDDAVKHIQEVLKDRVKKDPGLAKLLKAEEKRDYDVIFAMQRNRDTY